MVQRSQEAVDVAERVLEGLAEPIDMGEKELVVAASIGLCLTSDGTADAADLLRNADVAMYMAKRESKGSYRVFEPDMHREVVERLEMRADLQRALETGQLEVHYQPVIRLTGATVLQRDALPALAGEAAAGRKYDLVLVDPPYDRYDEMQPTLARYLPAVLAEDGLLVFETGARTEPELPLELRTSRRYGSARVTLFEH